VCRLYKGVTCIRYTNADCRSEYFRPFSCEVFHLCPSCSQKGTLLFAEFMNEQLLRGFFRHHRALYGQIAQQVYAMIGRFYNAAAGCRVHSAAIVAYASAGEFARFNSHLRAIALEGGFDGTGSPMQIIAVITEPQQVREILLHRIKTSKAPPGLDPTCLNGSRCPLASQESVCTGRLSQDRITALRDVADLLLALFASCAAGLHCVPHSCLPPQERFRPPQRPGSQSRYPNATPIADLTTLQVYNIIRAIS